MITLPININPKILIARIKESIHKEYSGELNGNEQKGTMKLELPLVGTFEGNYNFEGQTIGVNITKKPFFVSQSICDVQIKNYIKSFDY